MSPYQHCQLTPAQGDLPFGHRILNIMFSKLSLHNISDQLSELSPAGKVGIGILGVYCSYVGACKLYGSYRRLGSKRIYLKRREENARSIEDLANRLKLDPLPHDRVAYITKLSLAQLSKELKENKIRPIEALKAYQTKALEAHEKTNCLVEPIKEAEEWALQLEKGPREGALWGVPISIKDDVGIKGYDSAIGLASRVNDPMPEDSNIFKVLRGEGAIPFVKTNVPQLEMSFEPGNPINGVVHNPHKHGYGPGGSSSGEAALIASGGSVLGVGSDFGGSIRVPSHFCGVYGFKPTAERMSSQGLSHEEEKVGPILSTWGPLSRDVDGLVTMVKSLWNDKALAKADSECVPMEFDTKAYMNTRKLRIGYYVKNEKAPTFSACVRAVDVAKNTLAQLGHELVPWQPPKGSLNHELIARVLQADGGAGTKTLLQYETIDPTIKAFAEGAFVSEWYKRLLALLLRPLAPEFSQELIWSCGVGDIGSYHKLEQKLWEYRRLVQNSWNEAGLDAVICPPNVLAAPPLGNSELLLRTSQYTTTYNVLHCPAGVVPVTKVNQADLDRLKDDFPSGDKLNDQARVAMSNTKGLPVGVMVVSSRYQDEMCLRVMKILDEGLKSGLPQP